MKDWKVRLESLDRRLADWNAAYARALEAQLSARRGLLGRLRAPSRGELEAASPAALEATMAAEGEGPHAQISELFDDLTLYFIEASITERTKIRAAVGASRALLEPLWAWVLASVDLLRKPGDLDRLRRAVAGIAIDDLRTDIEDVRAALGRLWVTAVRAGLDPAPVFAEVARVANRGAGGGGAHMREVLTDFEHSSHFAAVVRPELAA